MAPIAAKQPRADVKVDRWFRPAGALTLGRGRPRLDPKCLRDGCKHLLLRLATRGLRPVLRRNALFVESKAEVEGLQTGPVPRQNRADNKQLEPSSTADTWCPEAWKRAELQASVGVETNSDVIAGCLQEGRTHSLRWHLHPAGDRVPG